MEFQAHTPQSSSPPPPAPPPPLSPNQIGKLKEHYQAIKTAWYVKYLKTMKNLI